MRWPARLFQLVEHPALVSTRRALHARTREPLLLQGCRVEGELIDIRIAHGGIAEIGRLAAHGTRSVHLHGMHLLPGLVNAHDHLHLDLCPHSGQGPYPSARAWAREFPRRFRPGLEPILAIPEAERMRWGGLRNLLSGVTWVAHHDRPMAGMLEPGFPTRVVYPYAQIDSLSADGARPGRGMRRPPSGQPFFIHLAEGIDASSAAELGRLHAMGWLSSHSVLVHGVALSSIDRRRVNASGAAVALCPASNRFLLGRAASAEGLDRVLIGTDSTLTGSDHLLDELRAARRELGFSPERLLEMVTWRATGPLGLPASQGHLRVGGAASLVALRGDDSPAQSLLAASPAEIEMVMVEGEIRVASERIGADLPGAVRVCGEVRRVRREDGELVARLASWVPRWVQPG